MKTGKWLGVSLLCLVSVSAMPTRAGVADYSDIAPGTSFTSPGAEFFSGGIRFETALFSHPSYPPPGFGHVDIDISANLGFGPDAVQTGNHLYPNNSSVIIDFAGSIGTQTRASILFTEGSGAVNFDVNNTDVNSALTGSGQLADLADNQNRNGVISIVTSLGGSLRRLDLFGPIDTVFLGGQEVIFGTVFSIMTSVVGDLNSDGFVGIADLSLILGEWNTVLPVDPRVDPSGDGFVGIDDLGVILGNWNAGTPPPQPAAGVNVPEPTTLAVFILGCALCTRRAHA